jgi:hypothetical protein
VVCRRKGLCLGSAFQQGRHKAVPPDGPILAVRLADLDEKEALLAANTTAFFTIPHFDGYAAILVQLKRVSKGALEDALFEGWLACAPAKLADRYGQG